MIKILKPVGGAEIYDIAACELQKFAENITGQEYPIVTNDDGKSDLILIGSDAVNPFCAERFWERDFEAYRIRYGTDDYQLESFSYDGRNMLMIAGGNGRGTLYGVYGYLERYCGCRYFWDGDVIPKADAIPLCDISVLESPRFEYRGIRYFAHRGLHRFQAEHWDFEDWKREIDWVLKKGLNLFMLRIGDDDLFQQTFPEAVAYPPHDRKLMENREGYTDRTSAWNLKFRGELRKKIMDYANARELMSPTDCGTMTHWYTRTPMDFLEHMKPETFSQEEEIYSEPETLVWDIRKQRNFDFYTALTEKSAELYDTGSIFHTVGFAERNYSSDPKKNENMKLYIYKKFADYLYQKHRDAKVFIAAWDLWMNYTDEQVQNLLKLLNPKQAIIFDYTSDTTRKSNFTTWGVMKNFPYIFGIFHAYAPDIDVRGNYDLTEERLAPAAEDDYCKGMIFWPEVSHSDTFMLEYFTQNAWKPLERSMDERIEKYCKDRYGDFHVPMQAIWKRFMPLVKLAHWSMNETERQPRNLFYFPNSLFRYVTTGADYRRGFDCDKAKELLPQAEWILEELANVWDMYEQNQFLRRDMFDIARTVMSRHIHMNLICMADVFLEGKAERKAEFLQYAADAIRMMELLCELVGEHEDYSLYRSFVKLHEASSVNPVFEEVLKKNSSCEYNRTYAYENLKELSLPELRYLVAWMQEVYGADKSEKQDHYRKQVAANMERYMKIPLQELGTHAGVDVKRVLRDAVRIL